LAKRTKAQLASELAKRKKWKEYSERATQYCRDVVSERIRACKWVRMACQRHLDDLVRSRGDWEFKFDAAKAGKACSFIERFPHVKGGWARGGQLIRLEPWQAFIICSIFGWVLKSTGMRRFTEADIFVPRKNGKTVLAAGIAIEMFIADGEPGSEVYTGASNRDQADEVFSPAAKMVRRAEGFKEWFGITIGKLSMYVLDEGSKFEKVIGNPGDGASPHCFIHDEFHEQPTFEQYETAKTGMMAREQALQLVISTAGFDTESPCKELLNALETVLDGTLVNERLFGINYTIDEPDKLVRNAEGKEVPYWTTVEALQEANPNFGISVLEDRLRADHATAIQRASRQNSFKVKHLNLWVNGRNPWMNREAWKACADKSLSVEEFLNDPCIEGFDLGARVDLTSRCKVFTRMIGSARHYYLFAKHYVPLDLANDGKHDYYERWVKDEMIVGHPGVEIQLPLVQKEVEADLEKFNYEALVFDPHQALQMQQELRPQLGTDSSGEDRLIDIPQVWKYLDPAMKEIEAAVLAKRLHHTGDPVLAWAIGNVVVKPDANENIFPRKENSASKIDPASALFNAMVRAAVSQGIKKSIYATRGLLTL
jgi:phage terminase large subunit-like protein